MTVYVFDMGSDYALGLFILYKNIPQAFKICLFLYGYLAMSDCLETIFGEGNQYSSISQEY